MISLFLYLFLLQEPTIDAVPTDLKGGNVAKELLAPEAPKPAAPPKNAAEPPPVVKDDLTAKAAGVTPAADAKTDGKNAAGENPAAGNEGVVRPETPWYVDMMSSGLMGYMIEGGFFMWPILILGILAVGVMIERYRSLNLLDTDTTQLRQQVLDLLTAGRIQEALQVCDSQQGPVPAILSQGLRKLLMLRELRYDPAKIEEQVIKAMDDYGMHIVAALERHLPILATVSSVAPMIGFLGTVQGMVISFKEMVVMSGEKNIIELAAAGIMVSLLTTVLGLLVGIPAFMAFNYFNTVINRYVLDVEESASELIETVTLQMAMDLREQPLQTAGSVS